MLVLDAPTLMNERIVCSVTAAHKFHVPANILLAIAEKEGGKHQQWIKNKNGSFDVGPMQFNTQYLKDLMPYGIVPEDVAKEGCFSYDLAAFRLKEHLSEKGADVFTKASNYHSRTPKYNALYREDLIKKAEKWGKWLDENFRKMPLPEKPTFQNVNHLKSKPLPTAKALLDAFYAPNRLEFYRKAL